MNEQRLMQIESYIVNKEEVTVKELQYAFKISINTLRSDLNKLEEYGIIQKKYGGVKYSCRLPFRQRLENDVTNKKNICMKAAELIEDGDKIFIDYGTTVSFIVDFIDPNKSISVITPNMQVIQACLDKKNIRLFVPAGEYSQYNHGFLSESTQQEFLNHSIMKAFMSCDGVDQNGTIQVTRIATLSIKDTVMMQSAKKILLSSSDKFLKTAPMQFANLSDFDLIITDNLLREDQENLCMKLNPSYIKV